jgi:phage shock protein E
MSNLPDFDLALGIKLLEKHNAILLDIRTYKEFCSGHLVGAIFVPTPLPPLSERELQNLQDQLWYKLRRIDKDRPIVLYCKKGVRAKIAKKIIKSFGFKFVTSLGGVEEPPLKSVFSRKNSVWPVCYCLKSEMI